MLVMPAAAATHSSHTSGVHDVKRGNDEANILLRDHGLVHRILGVSIEQREVGEDEAEAVYCCNKDHRSLDSVARWATTNVHAHTSKCGIHKTVTYTRQCARTSCRCKR